MASMKPATAGTFPLAPVREDFTGIFSKALGWPRRFSLPSIIAEDGIYSEDACRMDPLQMDSLSSQFQLPNPESTRLRC